jgi:hypothetical protein
MPHRAVRVWRKWEGKSMPTLITYLLDLIESRAIISRRYYRAHFAVHGILLFIKEISLKFTTGADYAAATKIQHVSHTSRSRRRANPTRRVVVPLHGCKGRRRLPKAIQARATPVLQRFTAARDVRKGRQPPWPRHGDYLLQGEVRRRGSAVVKSMVHPHVCDHPTKKMDGVASHDANADPTPSDHEFDRLS